MSALMNKPIYETNPLFNEVLYSARYLVNNEGSKTDVVVSLADWNKLLTLLEELDDQKIIQEWLPKLKAGPVSSGALRWEDVREEWEDDTSV
ncbi:MAG: hypothetical protein DRR16_07610 [Candidatus Parabeggiatoa sp. nov. 3]|nr:MAG: hypothetical protein DRR00_13845 [Gammaproteobacteria bacterium]RKZ65846.1 MAG: hypothetical protein DRQ99_11505 [Gammaproteobacteria bacterium]RKZ87310.1 MAG: hypothetical protein DRR16_07610 [Gammaproteobacteria bacterium]HEW98573.1 hypothetical protein [Beggiatoa sp.]